MKRQSLSAFIWFRTDGGKIFAWGLVFAVLAISCATAWAGPAEDEALRKAARNVDIDGIKLALSTGANPNAPPPANNFTPLSWAALGYMRLDDPDPQARTLAAVKTLFDAGAKLSPRDRSILFQPIAWGNTPLVRLLLDKGASPINKIDGYSPPEIAIKYGHGAAYELLLARGGVPVDSRVAAQLVFVQAISEAGSGRGDLQRLGSLLQAGARINDKDVTGTTALITATRTPIYTSESANVVRWLLENGADPNVAGESGFSGGLEGIPLHIFIAMNKHTLAGVPNRPEAKSLAETTLRLLLKFGAKVSGMDLHDKTPLHIAARWDNLVAAQILIEEGARVMARDSSGKSPLDYAESAPMIKLLKASGATER